MKKNFFQIITSIFALVLGFSSCKKDKEERDNETKTPSCIKCMDAEDNYTIVTLCVGDQIVETQEAFDAHAIYLRSIGYTVKEHEECPK